MKGVADNRVPELIHGCNSALKHLAGEDRKPSNESLTDQTHCERDNMAVRASRQMRQEESKALGSHNLEEPLGIS